MKKLFPFEECHLVNLVERPDRLEYMMNQFKKLGCETEITLHRAVKHPQIAMERMMDGLNNENNNHSTYLSHIDVPHSTAGCHEQYTIIKSAYLRGLESVMIIEDDCGFIKDRSVLEEYFNNLPNDWDVLRINCLRGPKTQEYINDYKDKYNYWFPQVNCLYGAAAYALSRKGMKHMLDWYDQNFDAIDVPLAIGNVKILRYELKKFIPIKSDAKFYIPKIPLGLCTEMNLKSDLHDFEINNCQNGDGFCYYFYNSINDINPHDYF